MLSVDVNARQIISLLPFFAHEAFAEREWVNWGRSELGPWLIFVDKESVREVEPTIYAAITYLDLGVLQRGLDEYDVNGKHSCNTRIRYRSYRSIDLYDCRSRKTATIPTRYYRSERPSREGLIHKVDREDPVWSTQILEPKFFVRL